MKISIVIAVYRNEGSIQRTYEKIHFVFTKLLSKYHYEIICVDDGSDDGSLKEILNLRKKDHNVRVLSFTRNFGQMAAMLAGLKEAKGDAVINISADMQDPVELLPQMVRKWEKGSEIVICYRTDRSDALISKVFSRLAYALLRLAIPQIPTGGFDFVLIDRKTLDEFNAIDVRNRFFQGDLLWTGFRTSFIPYVRLKRSIGKSQYNLTKKLKNFLDAFLDASYLSIRLISFIGVITSLFGAVYSITVVYSWLRGGTPFSGWAPLMIAIMLVGGLIMVMLGIIGEYIWRIYDEVRKKPNYIIREKYL
ncbi:MAG: YkcC [Microgenomates group bacterium GW2011_GWC1_43_11]|uniref:YkcC n=2 Tax=Candidatus Gottesmaniibacteriota TaxID=1752720 RepID=A0A0G1LP22_9BACT|nr:MAG: YkcC [Microgenomates group bacterium GW2011_GWC1_43_11]KKT39171.1 MAG: YkcC [Candidatus Gottesmanbacteria bacterium GW2011_GWB1_44_11c]KKT61644.1 MAG: YkcC [Candidatus Gottesmanbacteria bacterium GW2011_GWA1_44_24b]HCM82159.1 glycosyl transferase family 2 [Patescibacteria group bacterium]